jgi:predicted nucleic acid-binding protein
MNEVFLDAAYAIALSSPKDQYHDAAMVIAEKLEADRTQIVTTRAVMLEIGNALSKEQYREAAVALLDSLEEDPNVEIIDLDEILYKQGYNLFRKRTDKNWGMTDCISFIVMKNRDIYDALTTNEHFSQAGFNVLLGEKK